jgi:hypothetical protein
MAEIIKKIENLKPGKNYIFSVRTKNTDINAYSESVDSILVSIPKDTTIPDAISNLALYASFENVMFVFDFSNDLDIDKYEYELYDNGAGTGTATSTGFSSANVFTVAVPNSTDTVAKTYWGRVRSVDTTGNLGPWTALTQTDQSTPLIDSQYISSLTASKITAGTIGAQTITLSGANSILKSNNYAAANTTFGGTGWKISGDGKAVFNDASIRSSLDIGEDQGTSDATSFHVDSNGNMWSGSNSTSFSIAPFRVTNTGDVTANSLTLTGRTSLNNSGNASIFLTNNVDGIGLYSDANTAFYVDATDKFSLGNKLTWANSILTVQGVLKLSDGSDVVDAEEVGNIAQDLVDEFGNSIYDDGFIGGLTISASKMYYGAGAFASSNTAFYVAKNLSTGQADFSLGNKLTWDGTTLSITGNVAITGGTTYTTIQNAYDEANSASDSAGLAYSTAIDAYGIAISAQGTADDAYSEAITKIGPGTLIAEINGAATKITGDQIESGTIRASTSFIAEGSGIFRNSDSSFYVDAGGGVSTDNILSSRGNLAIDIALNDECNMVRLGNPVTTGTFTVFGNLRYKTASTYSDKRIKNTITPIESSINFINKLEPVSYYLNHFSHEDTLNSITTDNTGKRKHFGLVAQDVKAALDNSGYPSSEYSLWKGSEPGEEDRLQSVSYDEMVPHLVKAVQELSAKIEELESRLNS